MRIHFLILNRKYSAANDQRSHDDRKVGCAIPIFCRNIYLPLTQICPFKPLMSLLLRYSFGVPSFFLLKRELDIKTLTFRFIDSKPKPQNLTHPQFKCIQLRLNMYAHGKYCTVRPSTLDVFFYLVRTMFK